MSRRIGGTRHGADNGNDVLTDRHADAPHQEQVAAAELFDQPEAGERGCDVDGVGDDLDVEGIVEPGVEEVLSSVVDCSSVRGGGYSVSTASDLGVLTNEIYASELLEGLETATRQETLSNGPLEAVPIRRFAQAHLIQVVCLDFVEFFFDGRMVGRQTSQLA